MSDNNQNQPSPAEKFLALLQLPSLIMGSGVMTQSQPEVEHRDNRPSFVQTTPPQYEDLPGILKGSSLEDAYGKLVEDAQAKQENESEISTLAANEFSVSGSPPEPESELAETQSETEVNSEIEATSESNSESEGDSGESEGGGNESDAGGEGGGFGEGGYGEGGYGGGEGGGEGGGSKG
jgi:hypothetical protein